MYFFILLTGCLATVLCFSLLAYEYRARKTYYTEKFNATLWVEKSSGEPAYHNFTSTYYVLGRRKRRCDIYLGEDDPTVGREHAVIWYNGSGFSIKGTPGHSVYIKGEAVPEEGIALKYNDTITVGCTVLHFTRGGERFEM